MIAGRSMLLRRARGYAPLPIAAPGELPASMASGAHLKNTVAVACGAHVFLSQHIGDLETSEALSAYRQVADDLPRLFDAAPSVVACDLHPDYLSTKHAEGMGLPVQRVQHHWAHILACMAENEIEAPVLGVAWDGTGYGLDGTIWGGEFLDIHARGFTRFAHLRTFPLPGGEAAIRQPGRTALGLLHEMMGAGASRHPAWKRSSRFAAPADIRLLEQALNRGLNAPRTSSIGRLFDGVSALLGIRENVAFEGQSAMELEFAVRPGKHGRYPYALRKGVPMIIDWEAIIDGILADAAASRSVGEIAWKFHGTLAEIVVAIALRRGCERVVLSGGCFQNRVLSEMCIQQLREAGFRPYWHQRVPPNDGGIALGQIMALAQIRVEAPNEHLHRLRLEPCA